MAQLTGLKSSYVNTAPDKRMVTDRILMIEPLDIVAYSVLGTDMEKFNFVNREGKIYEWLEDTYNPQTDTMVSGMAASTTTTTFTPTSGNLYQKGDLLQVGTEYMWVSGVTPATPVVTVTRGYASTTKATHANASVVYFRGRARIDGAAADDSPHTEIATNYNYTQIMQRTVEISRTKEKIAEYGVASWEDYDIDKHMDELMRLLAVLPYYGKRYAGLTAAGRTAGGFAAFITNNITYATSTGATGGTALPLTRKNVDDTFENIWADGGDPDVILMNSWPQRKMNDFFEAFVQTERSEELGGVLIKKLLHPISGKMISMYVDRNAPSNEMHLLTSKHIAYYPFDPFFYERLAKSKDTAAFGQVVGEYGFVCAYDKAHGSIKEFSTSA